MWLYRETMIRVVTFVKIAHDHNDFNSSQSFKCLLWTNEYGYISEVLKRQIYEIRNIKLIKCEILMLVKTTNSLRYILVLLCPNSCFAAEAIHLSAPMTLPTDFWGQCKSRFLLCPGSLFNCSYTWPWNNAAVEGKSQLLIKSVHLVELQ